MNDTKELVNGFFLPIMSDGTIARYTSYGSYPLFFLDCKDNVLCYEHAEEACRDYEEAEEDMKECYIDELPVSYHINYESLLYCECGNQIESAYGIPGEDDE